ncbi:MAG: alpha/beta hydrolase [Methylobacteriaceae bacterium]|nr:alpha/beta hydrolase [Methylobacteriaceae bacterium]
MTLETPPAPLRSFTLTIGTGSQTRHIAVIQRPARKANAENAPLVVWFHGFRSSMHSVKAEALDGWAERNGLGLLRFDYSGHGDSSGRFEDATISRWLEEALAVIRSAGEKHVLLIGSSLGGWMVLLAAQALRADPAVRVTGLVTLAPAVNFTERLLWQALPPTYQEKLLREKVLEIPEPESDTRFTIGLTLIEDGRTHLLYREPLILGAPIHIIQGKEDTSVPWQTAQELFEHCAQDPAELTFVADGSHRLERPQDLALIERALEGMLGASNTGTRKP